MEGLSGEAEGRCWNRSKFLFTAPSLAEEESLVAVALVEDGLFVSRDKRVEV